MQALGVPAGSWFSAASAPPHRILGTAAQNAANARALGSAVDRAEFLAGITSG